MKEHLKEMRREIFSSVRKNYAKSLPNIAILVLVSVAVGALTMALYYLFQQAAAGQAFSGQAAFLTVSFLLVPFAFAFQSSYRMRESTTVSGVPSILTRFGSYYSPLNFGSYRLIRNFLWSYVIYFVISSMVSTIAAASMAANPAYFDVFTALTDYIAAGQMEEAVALLAEEPFTTIFLASTIASMVAYLASNFYFFFRALPIPYVDGNIKNAPARLKVAIFRGGKRMAGSSFEKEYWYFMWPAFLIAAVFLGGGTYLGYLLFSRLLPTGDPLIIGGLAPIFGFFVGTIVLSFAAPYFFECLLAIQNENAKSYGQYGYNIIRQNLEYLRATEQMRQEQASNLEETLKDMEQQNDDVIDVEAREKEPNDGNRPSPGGPSKDDYGRSDSHRE